MRAKTLLSSAPSDIEGHWNAGHTEISEPIRLAKSLIEISCLSLIEISYTNYLVLQAKPFIRHHNPARCSGGIEIDCSLESNIKPEYLRPEDGSKRDDNARPTLVAGGALVKMQGAAEGQRAAQRICKLLRATKKEEIFPCCLCAI